MKNLLKLFALAAMVVMFGGCSKPNTPSGVAEQAMSCLKSKDYKGYVDLLYFSDKVKKEDLEKTKQQYVSILESKMSEEFDKQGGIKKYEVASENITDSTANVKMNITYGNDSTKVEDMKLRMDKGGDWKLDSGK